MRLRFQLPPPRVFDSGKVEARRNRVNRRALESMNSYKAIKKKINVLGMLFLALADAVFATRRPWQVPRARPRHRGVWTCGEHRRESRSSNGRDV